jgi:membrane associated rhomboid family serine protease
LRPELFQGKPAKAILAVNIRILRLLVLLGFFALDMGYWIYDKLYKCNNKSDLSDYCYTKVNYTAHLFGTIAGLLVC